MHHLATKYFTFLLYLTIAGLLVNCSGDGDDRALPQSENTLRYNNTNYSVNFGLLKERGTSDHHTRAHFGVTDGGYVPILTPAGNFYVTLWVLSDAGIEVYAELYSPDTTSFRAGTFELQNEENRNDPELINTFFFTEAYVAIDSNGDQDLDQSEEITVRGGTIDVSGNYPDLVLTYDLQLADGSTLRGSYSNAFLVTDK